MCPPCCPILPKTHNKYEVLILAVAYN
uniref:Uncharacterized protein n=1 Tax=Anguilla anguilla TaxID=7936 RepID=A0A0E9UWJ8_ANGAN